MTYHLQQAAARHREQADAYENLASLLQRLRANAEPAPIRELAAVLAPMGLHIVPGDLLTNIRECLDPCAGAVGFGYEPPSNENMLAYANALRAILHPDEPGSSIELPL